MPMSSEEAIEKIGGFGWFQLRVCLFVAYSIFFTSMVMMVMTFSTAEPPWRCNDNSTVCTLNGTYKVGDQHYEHRCGIPRKDWQFALEGDFDSIVTEWDLVCDTAIYASLANSLLFILWMFGAMLGSVLSDKYGRKSALFSFSMLSSACGLASAFAQSYWVFALFRALAGVGIGGCSVAEFTLVMEYIGKKQRGIVGIAIWWSWISTLLVLVLLAYLIPSWRTLSIITSSPGLLFFLLWWFVPESLRWLLVKGKNKEACDILKAAAKINNKAITDETLNLLEKDVKSSERLGDVRDLFANRFVTHRILVSWYCWFVSTMVYYGITLSSPSIGGSMYLNFFITTVCEAFAMMVAIASLQWLGRRKSMAFSLWLAGLVGIVAAVLSYFDDGSEGYEAGKILMAMVLGKIFITIAFDVVYLYSSELFPTVVRNTAMGTSTSAGRIGSASAPYIVFSQRVHPLMPFGIMAVNALICGMLCMTLPETKDKAMPDTIQQVGKNSQDSGIKFIDKGVPTADDEKTKLAPNNIMIETMA